MSIFEDKIETAARAHEWARLESGDQPIGALDESEQPVDLDAKREDRKQGPGHVEKFQHEDQQPKIGAKQTAKNQHELLQASRRHHRLSGQMRLVQAATLAMCCLPIMPVPPVARICSDLAAAGALPSS